MKKLAIKSTLIILLLTGTLFAKDGVGGIFGISWANIGYVLLSLITGFSVLVAAKWQGVVDEVKEAIQAWVDSKSPDSDGGIKITGAEMNHIIKEITDIIIVAAAAWLNIPGLKFIKKLFTKKKKK